MFLFRLWMLVMRCRYELPEGSTKRAYSIYKSLAVAEIGDRLATIHMVPKVGAAVLLPWGAGSPSNTMSPGPRPTSVPSGILIHPTVWPQYTNVADRTNRTTVP